MNPALVRAVPPCRRLAGAVFGTSLMVAVLASAAQVGLHYRGGVRVAGARLQEIERVYAPTLSASLGESNEAATARLRDDIAAMPEVAALTLTDGAGHAQSRRNVARADLPLGLREDGQAVALGRLQVKVDHAAVMAGLASQAVAITFAVTLLCSALCIAFLFERLVGRQLADIAAQVRPQRDQRAQVVAQRTTALEQQNLTLARPVVPEHASAGVLVTGIWAAKPREVPLSASGLQRHIGKRARKGKALVTKTRAQDLRPIG